jgi:predicted amino acid-binding ACT domain protein
MAKHLATITLIGNDKAGVIARITQLLFQLGANIEAMEEQVTRGQFSMTLQASWTAARFDRAAIERSVKATGTELKMDAKIHFAPVGPQRLAILVTKEPHVIEGLLAKAKSGLATGPTSSPSRAKTSCPFFTSPSTTAPRRKSRSLRSLSNTKSILSSSRAS